MSSSPLPETCRENVPYPNNYDRRGVFTPKLKTSVEALYVGQPLATSSSAMTTRRSARRSLRAMRSARASRAPARMTWDRMVRSRAAQRCACSLMNADALSATLFALADPTRRGILARLASGDATVKDLARPYDMSLAAVSKHLKVLERAGLIERGREAQWRPCRLRPAPLRDVADYIFGPDMGTDETCMAWVHDEIGRAVGWSAPSFALNRFW